MQNQATPQPVKILAILVARPDKADDLAALLGTMVGASRAEPGNLRYDLWRDRADPGRFVLDELYVDETSVAAHRATAHFQHYLSRIGDLADRSVMTLDPREVA
ncbi:putative quinol monooxygenase [Aquabacter spiritensis]|uniref:Quinol monooxygenase YgiN n=1 Tax=Aquabacter spiritensis TaxID=933073 RepID=A0A4R3LXV0_9HYPH|nr:putative quinol monooxygenase [Aquabacter spiritensis]TCT05494.1 quinol monooxygenase YgiN [Aquabacter spiritensis]